MKIETKYEIGDRVWHIYTHQGEICMYDEPIIEICYSKDGLGYMIDKSYEVLAEDDVVLFGDNEAFAKKIYDLAKKIREEEGEE